MHSVIDSMIKPLKLERGRLEIYRTFKLTTAPFPTCEFTQLELSSLRLQILQCFNTVSAVGGIFKLHQHPVREVVGHFHC